jgi:hypothetical protein
MGHTRFLFRRRKRYLKFTKYSKAGFVIWGVKEKKKKRKKTAEESVSVDKNPNGENSKK